MDLIAIVFCVLLAVALLLTLLVLAIMYLRRWHDREAGAEVVELERTEVRDSVVEAAIGMHSASVIQMCHAIRARVDEKIPTEVGRGDAETGF